MHESGNVSVNLQGLGRKWPNLRLRAKGFVVLALPLAALLVNGAAMRLVLTKQSEAQHWLRHTLNVRIAIGAVLANVGRISVDLSSFKNMKDPHYLQRADQDKADLFTSIEDLQVLMADNPRQRARLVALRSETAVYVPYIFDHLLSPEKETPGTAAAGRATRRALDTTVRDMDAEEATLEIGRSRALDRVQGWLKILEPLSLILGILGGLVGMWLFITGIERRAAYLKQQVALLADGLPMGEIDRHRDEIGEVSSGLVDTGRLLNEKQRRIQQEITERIAAEKRLIEQREQLRLTLETASDAFVATDLRGRITNWNRAAQTLFGWKPEEAIGSELSEFLLPERYREALQIGMRRYVEERSSGMLGRPIELAAVTRKNIEVPVEITIWPLSSNGEVSFQAFLRDISARKAGELEKRRDIELSALLQEITGAANKAGTTEEAVKACLRQVSKAAGFQLAHLYLIDPDTRDLISSGIWYDSDPVRFAPFRELSATIALGRTLGVPGVVLSERTPMWFEETKLNPALVRGKVAGQVGLCSALAFPVTTGNNILGILEFFSTEFKRRDEKLLNISVQIGVQVGQVIARNRMEDSLREAKEAAEMATQAKSAFLASMSHEIRTPMNAILGMADLLWESKLSPEQRQYVEVFRRAGNNLLTLINDILDLSKIESGHFELEQIAFDLQDLIDRTIELIEPKARGKGLRLTTILSPELPESFIGDPTRLQQVLINLLGNAVKFTEKGSVSLSITPEGSTPGHLSITISDTGIGVPNDKLATIFGDFTQADSSTTRRFGGTGLGLGICKRLVSRMGGKLEVDSEVGRGSTFRFTAQLGTAIRPVGKTARSVEDFCGKRVLVIDDDPTNRLIACEILTGWGFETDDFSSTRQGAAALSGALLAGEPYALVLLDSRMPDLDGFEAREQVRRIAPSVPVILLTSDDSPGNATRCQQLGIIGYAVKPLRRDHLLRLVCRSLGSEPTEEAFRGRPKQLRALNSVPLRVLVAEDSRDNQILLEAYLKDGPYDITFVEDGALAVERFAEGVYKLVIMDIQMPVMDGLEATRRIRHFEREKGLARTPIISLTANALPRDVEAALQAGSDSHLAKPISKQKLLDAIAQWQTPAFEKEQKAVDIVSDMPPEFAEHAARYLAGKREQLPTLQHFLSESDFSKISSLAHNLKGTGTSFGFPELSRIGGEMEDAARTSDAGSLARQLEELSDYLSEAAAVVENDLAGVTTL